MTSLTYIKYNNRSLAVRGDRNKYADEIKRIGGRWNVGLKGGEGWTVPVENEYLLKSIIEKELANSQPKTSKKSQSQEKIPDAEKKSQSIRELLDIAQKNVEKESVQKRHSSPSPSRSESERDSEREHSDDDPPAQNKVFRRSRDYVQPQKQDSRPKQREEIPPKREHTSKYRKESPPRRHDDREKHRKKSPPRRQEHETKYRKESPPRRRDDGEKYRRESPPRRQEYETKYRKDSPPRRQEFVQSKNRDYADRTSIEKKSERVLTRYDDFGRKPIDFRRLQATMNETDSDSDVVSDDSRNSTSNSSSSFTPVKNRRELTRCR